MPQGKVVRVPASTMRRLRVAARLASVDLDQVLRTALIAFARLGPELQASLCREFMDASPPDARPEVRRAGRWRRLGGRFRAAIGRALHAFGW